MYESWKPLISKVRVKFAESWNDKWYLFVNSVLWKKRVGFSELNEVMVIEW